MQAIPTDIFERYLVLLKKRAIPVSRHADYKKWLRYFLDFRRKYKLPDSRSDQVRMFIQKLRSKKQSQKQLARQRMPPFI
jgi:hypothetical protein